MKPLVLCLLNKIDSSKLDGFSKVYLKSFDYDYVQLGLGRQITLPQDIIKKELDSSDFYCNINLINAINHAKNNKSKIHLIGDINNDRVNLDAIIKTCNDLGVKEVHLHVFSNRKPNVNSLKKELGIGKLCNVINSNLLTKDISEVYDVIVRGKANGKTKSLHVSNNDTIIFFNNDIGPFDTLISSMTAKTFDDFKRVELKNIKILTMFSYDKTTSMYEMPKYDCLGECISNANLKQLRCNVDNYVLDGYQCKKFKNEKIINKNIFDIDLTKYDFVLTKLDNKDIVRMNDYIKNNNGILLLVGKENDKAVFMISEKVSLKTNNPTSIPATILKLLKIKKPKDMDNSLIMNKGITCGYIFRYTSILFIIFCVVYYMTRFLHFYLTK